MAAAAADVVIPMEVDTTTESLKSAIAKCEVRNYELIYWLTIQPVDPSRNTINNENEVWQYATQKLNEIKMDGTKTVVNEEAIAKHIAKGLARIQNFFPPSMHDVLNYYIADFQMTVNDETYSVLIQFFDFKNPLDICPQLMETEFAYGTTTFKGMQNIINYHFILTQCLSQISRKYFPFVMNKMIEEMEFKSTQLYNLTPLVMDARLRTTLFPNQIDNINYMMDLAKNKPTIHIHNNKVYEMCGMYCLYNNSNEPIDIKYPTSITKLTPYELHGAVLCDDVGIGKTIQALVFWMTFRSKHQDATCVVIVPPHLTGHWSSEITKHFGVDQLPGMTVINRDDTIEYLKVNKADVMIIDEFHELYEMAPPAEIVLAVCNYRAMFKLAITATPFMDDKSLKKIVDYLTCTFRTSDLAAHYRYIRDQMKIAFIRKTKDSIKDTLVLPEVCFNDIYVDMRPDESAIYNAEKDGLTDTSCLLQIAANAYLTSSEQDDVLTTIRPAEFRSRTLAEMQREYDNTVATAQRLEEEIKEIEVKHKVLRNDILPTTGLFTHVQALMRAHECAVDHSRRRLTVLQRYQESIKQIDDIMSQVSKGPGQDGCAPPDDTNCQVCFGEFTSEGIAWLRKCGHYCCIDCFKRCDAGVNHICFMCRTPYDSGDVQLITELNVSNVSSKIKEVLRLLMATQGREKFIIYTQYDKFIVRLLKIFKRFQIKVITIDDIMGCDYRTLDYDVILLSSKRNASGLDLTAINNVIIMDPFENYTYCRAIEKQLVGRVHRIGQEKPVNVYRLIMKGTVEESIYSS
jgi:hypothetical protein